jgi:hypothetical protein
MSKSIAYNFESSHRGDALISLIMQERDWSKLGWAVVWLVLTVLVIIQGLGYRSEIRDIQKNGITVEGIVTSSFPGFKSRDDAEPPRTDYEFEYNGRTYSGSSELYIPEGESLEVRYLQRDPRKSFAVGHREGFDYYIITSLFMGGFGIFLFMAGYSEETARRVTDKGYKLIEPTPLIRFPIVILGAMSALMLYNAPGDNPYWYYQLLRWLVCGTACLFAYYTYQWQKPWIPWLFGLVAILLNPLVPFHFSRRIWGAIDLVAAIAMLAAAILLVPPVEERK